MFFGLLVGGAEGVMRALGFAGVDDLGTGGSVPFLVVRVIWG